VDTVQDSAPSRTRALVSVYHTRSTSARRSRWISGVTRETERVPRSEDLASRESLGFHPGITQDTIHDSRRGGHWVQGVTFGIEDVHHLDAAHAKSVGDEALRQAVFGESGEAFRRPPKAGSQR
jgi:hypothetical protein